jgi:hypothetical protein
MKNNKFNIGPLVRLEERIVNGLTNQRDKTAVRYPLFFGMAVTFGLVATFYGFEGLINKVTWLQENPWATLLVGVTVLIITGTAYKKLN